MIGAIRRRALLTGAAAAALPLVHVRTAGAAGTLSVGFPDHWHPAGNDAIRALVEQWADQSKTSVRVDFITPVGDQNLLALATEAEERSGHDVQTFPTWEVQRHAHLLEALDDVVGRLEGGYGKLAPASSYLAAVEGAWRAVPSSSGSQNQSCCGRISFFAANGLDLESVFPAADAMGDRYAGWTWEALLDLAPKAQRAGLPFGLPLGQFPGAVDWTGSLFAAFGAQLVDATGNVTVRSDAVRHVLEWAARLVPFLPGDVFSWDDASNNRALLGAKSALIINPPTAWAVARTDVPEIAEDCWTFPNPAGPAGRFLPYVPSFWGVWSFARNKSAAKDLIEWLSQREQAEQLCTATRGCDVPPFESMTDFPVWAEEGPPTGTVFNYPLRPQHRARAQVAAYPAPPDIAARIYGQATMPRMIARCTQGGQTVEQTIAWAEGELEGFSR